MRKRPNWARWQRNSRSSSVDRSVGRRLPAHLFTPHRAQLDARKMFLSLCCLKPAVFGENARHKCGAYLRIRLERRPGTPPAPSCKWIPLCRNGIAVSAINPHRKTRGLSVPAATAGAARARRWHRRAAVGSVRSRDPSAARGFEWRLQIDHDSVHDRFGACPDRAPAGVGYLDGWFGQFRSP